MTPSDGAAIPDAVQIAQDTVAPEGSQCHLGPRPDVDGTSRGIGLLEILALQRRPAIEQDVRACNSENLGFSRGGDTYVLVAKIVGVEQPRVRIPGQVRLLPRRNAGVLVQQPRPSGQHIAAVYRLAREDRVFVRACDLADVNFIEAIACGRQDERRRPRADALRSTLYPVGRARIRDEELRRWRRWSGQRTRAEG